MNRARRFTLVDATVLAGLGAIALVLIAPGCGRSPRRSDRVRNQANLRGIVNAFIMWADARDEARRAASQPETSEFPYGTTLQRFEALLAATNDPLSPKFLLKPRGADQEGEKGKLRKDNVSYALLHGRAENDRSKHWHNDMDASVPLICDKVVGAGTFWYKEAWVGHVGWGDAHVS